MEKKFSREGRTLHPIKDVVETAAGGALSAGVRPFSVVTAARYPPELCLPSPLASHLPVVRVTALEGAV